MRDEARHALPVLVVEDDADLREAIIDTLSLAGYATLEAADGHQALACLKRELVGLVLSDAQMQPMDGYQLFAELRSRHPGIPFILMTAYGVIERAIELLRNGASHYLLKPFEPDGLIAEVERHILKPRNQAEPDMVAQDASIQEMLRLASRVAVTDATVLLNGESGVGKEVVARFLHRHSMRADAPFVAVNCAAIPENLLESTLFGHEKGAFTGASSSFAGKFEQAQGGTLLLDEVSEMPLALQAKLLRVLQERELERVGGTRTLKLDVRVICTTNRVLADEVRKGTFREDLYFRINVFPLTIPPLRQRKGDIVPLAQHFLEKYAPTHKKHPAPALSAAAIEHLTGYQWNGNIRELENVMQRALILSCGESILPQDLMLQVLSPPECTAPDATPGESEGVAAPTEDDMSMHLLEKRHILDTLATVNGVRKLAAEKLGISERTLRYKLQRYREEETAPSGAQEQSPAETLPAHQMSGEQHVCTRH